MGGGPSEDLRFGFEGLGREAWDEGLTARQAAAEFGARISSEARCIARSQDCELTPRPQERRRTSSYYAHEAFIVGLNGF